MGLRKASDDWGGGGGGGGGFGLGLFGWCRLSRVGKGGHCVGEANFCRE